jgi:hypothetical protein
LRTIFSFLLLFYQGPSFSQIQFPHDFKLVKGERGSGADDYYTNGNVSFETDNPFVDHDFVQNVDSNKSFLSVNYGLPFKVTKDGLYQATGKVNGFYKYIIVVPPGEPIILSSKYNDVEFSNSSSWLISTIRNYKKNGKNYSFPFNLQNFKSVNSENLGNRIIDTIANLKEVKQLAAYLKDQTNGKRHLHIAIYERPNNTKHYYLVKVMEDNGDAYVTHFNFYVYPKTMAIKYLETVTGEILDLNSWRKREKN